MQYRGFSELWYIDVILRRVQSNFIRISDVKGNSTSTVAWFARLGTCFRLIYIYTYIYVHVCVRFTKSRWHRRDPGDDKFKADCRGLMDILQDRRGLGGP